MKLQRFFAREENSTGSAALILMVSLLAANLLGLLKLRLFAQFFRGASSDLGIFIAADRLPNFIFSVLAVGALSASFVPIFSQNVAAGKKERAFELVTTLFNLSLLTFFFVSLFFFLFSKNISNLIAWGSHLSEGQLNLLDDNMRILFLAQIFFIFSAFSSGVLQSFNRFRIIALPPIIYNLVIIVFTYFFAPRLGILAAAWGTVLGAFFHFLVQAPALVSVGFSYSSKINLKIRELREIGRLFLPRSLSLTVDQLGLLFFTTLSLSLSAGSVVIFSFAQRLMFLPVTLFGSTFSQASLATLSKNAELNQGEFLKIFDKVFNYLSFLVLPTTVFFVVLRIPLVRLFFGARGFDLVATTLTGSTLSFLALGIFFESQTSLLARAFFAQKNTAVPLKSALFSLLGGVVSALVFLRFLGWGVWSLGLSASLVSLLDFAIMFFYLSAKFPDLKGINFWRPTLKMTSVSLLAGLVSLTILKSFDSRFWLFDTHYGWGVFNLTALSLTVGGAFYLAGTYALGLREGRRVVSLLKGVRSFGPNFLAELFQE